MIFQHTIEQLLKGEKTQTRRPVKEGDRPLLDEDGKVMAVENRNAAGRPFTRYRVGAEYAVQPGRGKHSVGRIELLEIRYCEHAGQLSERDARAEGYGTADGFRETYGVIHDSRELARPCWALTFRLLPGK